MMRASQGAPHFHALLVVLLAAASTACSPAQPASDASNLEELTAAAGATVTNAPLSTTAASYDRTRIEVVLDDTYTNSGKTYHRVFYRNTAYHCGRTGYFTFVVLEPLELVGKTAPLWVGLHGGGNGYYGSDGRYHPGEYLNGQWVATNEVQNDENTASQLSGAAVRLGRPGTRLVALSMCDHDLYAGMGGAYPNNPTNPTDRVEGLLASVAAVRFVVEGNGLTGPDALPGYPTSLVFFRGSSAGSAGAYHVSAALARLGFRINGAILDSYSITTRHPELFAAGCTPLNRDPEFDSTQAMAKIGPFGSNSSLYLENNVPGPYALPYLVLQGTADGHCCGSSPVLPGASALGFTNNCRYVYDTIASAFATASTPLNRIVFLEGEGHGVGDTPGGHAAIEDWLADVLAAGPVAPAFPE